MPAVLEQHSETEDLDGSSSGASVSAPALTLTAGNCVIVSVFWKTDVTITGLGGIAGEADCGAGRLARPTDGYIQKYHVPNVAGGSTTVVANFSGTATEMCIYVEEWSGLATASADDGTATGTATSGTSVTSGTLNTTNADDLLHAYCSTNDTNGSAGANYTAIVTTATSGSGTEYRIVSATGGYTASLTLSDAITKGAIILSAIKIAAAATAAVTGTATASITESDIVTGGKTIIITLSGTTWVT